MVDAVFGNRFRRIFCLKSQRVKRSSITGLNCGFLMCLGYRVHGGVSAAEGVAADSGAGGRRFGLNLSLIHI